MVTVRRLLSILLLLVGICMLASAQRIPANITTKLSEHGKFINELKRDKADQAALDALARRTDAEASATKQELAKKPNTEEWERKANTSDLGLKASQADLDKLRNTQSFTTDQIDRFWVLLAALLVFFMQAGFLFLEVGMVRKEYGKLQAAYKLLAWIGTYTGYFIGFGLMFSTSKYGWIGWHSSLWLENVIGDINKNRGTEFFLFQAAFAATAVTIPSGAAAERMGLRAYFLMGVFIALIAYPVFGHWAWGGALHTKDMVKAHPEVQGWLSKIGFHDFAGSTVVHSIGGWFALIAALFLKQRDGRFTDDGSINVKGFTSWNPGVAVFGAFLLWFGWWGFNGGSKLGYNPSIANIILNTNIAGAAAGIAAWTFARQEKKWSNKLKWFKCCEEGFATEKLIGGVLGGLVAITASCDQASPTQALFIGLSAGIIHNLSFDLLLNLKIDDPVGAVPVHLGCGIWGTLCVAVTFANVGTQFGDHVIQFGIQFLGVVSAGIWAVLTAMLCFGVLSKLGILKPTDEDKLRNLET